MISPLRRPAMSWCTHALWRNWNPCGRRYFKAALSANDGSLLRRIRRLTNPVAAHRPAGWGAAWSLGALLLLGIAGVAVTGAQGQSQPVVDLDKVWPDTVKQGDMKLEVARVGPIDVRPYGGAQSGGDAHAGRAAR